MKTGQIASSKRRTKKPLHLDAYHQIALKNLKNWDLCPKKTLLKLRRFTPQARSCFWKNPKNQNCGMRPQCAIPNTLPVSKRPGSIFKSKNHVVEVRDEQDRYLAAIPMTSRLSSSNFAGGNTYQALMKGADAKSLKIFLRETSRGKNLPTNLLFTSTTSYIPFAKGGNLGAGVAEKTADTEEKDEDEGDEN